MAQVAILDKERGVMQTCCWQGPGSEGTKGLAEEKVRH